MTLTVLTAIEANFVSSGRDMGMPHPEATFEMVLQSHSGNVAKSAEGGAVGLERQY